MSKKVKKSINRRGDVFLPEEPIFDEEYMDPLDDDVHSTDVGSVLYPMSSLVGVQDFGPEAFGWEVYGTDGRTVVSSGIEDSYQKALLAVLDVYIGDDG